MTSKKKTKIESKFPLNEEDTREERNPSIKSLITDLSSEDHRKRLRARLSLMAMGKTAVPSLVEALKTTNDQVRWESAKVLEEIGDPGAAPALLKALEDEEFDIRWLAAQGLTRMNLKGLKPLLQALIERGDSILLREGAHHVIHDLAKGELRKYLSPVMHALEDIEPSVEVRVAAFHALEGLEEIKKL